MLHPLQFEQLRAPQSFGCCTIHPDSILLSNLCFARLSRFTPVDLELSGASYASHRFLDNHNAFLLERRRDTA